MRFSSHIIQVFCNYFILTTSISLPLIGLDSVFATTLVHRSMKDLVARSVVVISGDVQKVESFVREDGMIFTQISYTNIEPVLGEYDGSTLELTLPGGDVEGKRHIIDGVPIFQVGDRVILFLKETKQATQLVPISGWVQGVFRINPQNSTVHNYYGQAVYGLNAQGDLELSNNILLPGADTHPASNTEVEIMAVSQRVVASEVTSVTPVPVGQQQTPTSVEPEPAEAAMTESEFRDLILSLVDTRPTNSESSADTRSQLGNFGAGEGEAKEEPSTTSVSLRGVK
jgi:hypothetical protein